MSLHYPDSLFPYQIAEIHADPTGFDRRIIAALRIRYAPELQHLFGELRREVQHQALPTYLPKCSRHLYPAFVAAESLQAIDLGFLTLCKAFLLGYSLPILALDRWSDSDAPPERKALCEGFHLVYRAQDILLNLTNGPSLALTINNIYAQVTESILLELNGRYNIPEVDLEADFVDKAYYRSLCGYMSAFVGAVLEYYELPISGDMQRYLRLFGVLRQMIDELADVEEDLTKGNVTLPVLFAHQQVDLHDQLHEYWNRRIPFSQIQAVLLHTRAYEAVYDRAMRLYERARCLRFALEADNPRLIHNISLFYDLKLCQLLRIRRNGWLDNLKEYP